MSVFPHIGYTGYYKVGKTDDLKERIKNLQTGNPNELQYIKYYEVMDMDTAGKNAHAAVMQVCEFDALRRIPRQVYKSDEKGGTEWFKVHPLKEADFIRRIEQSLGIRQ